MSSLTLTRLVAITGCDSGLGWALAARSAREGLITVAGMYNGITTEAAKELNKLSAYTCQLDVTSQDSVNKFKCFVDDILKNNPSYELHALVNNAGVMTVGDYEWQTQTIVENIININLLGAMRVTSTFLPDLRRSALKCLVKPRIINTASHCGLMPLPGFGVYSASKAGLIAWTKALRFEQRPYGLSVVNFVPGGFVGSSNILSTQVSHGKAMLEHFDEEQKSIYGKRLITLNDYLGTAAVGQNINFDSLRDEEIIETFIRILTDENPKEIYKVENWRYKIYYSLLMLPLPESIRSWLMKRFLSFPEQ